MRAEPEPDLARRAQFGEAIKDGANGAGDSLIGMKKYFAVLVAPDKAYGQTSAQLTAGSLVADPAIEAGANDMQLCFTHGAFESEDQAVIEKRRVIEPIAIADQSVGDAAEIEQAIPIGIIAREARNFETKDDADSAESNFGGQACEAGALGHTGAGKTEVLINEDHLLVGPTELPCPLGQRVLPRGRFPVLLHLGGGGLAYINDGSSLNMSRFDLGGIGHCSAPE